jgi:hypothetical protein
MENVKKMKSKKSLIVILIFLNSIVLLGQIYPTGAPPFARVVNVIFLIFSLVFFISEVTKQK